jgi:hypothetical protein
LGIREGLCQGGRSGFSPGNGCLDSGAADEGFGYEDEIGNGVLMPIGGQGPEDITEDWSVWRGERGAKFVEPCRFQVVWDRSALPCPSLGFL